MAQPKFSPSLSPELYEAVCRFVTPDHDYEAVRDTLERIVASHPEDIHASYWLAASYYYDFCDERLAPKTLPERMDVDQEPAEMLLLRLACYEQISSIDTNCDVDIATAALAKRGDWVTTHMAMAECCERLETYDEALREIEIARQIWHPRTEAEAAECDVEDHYRDVLAANTNSAARVQIDVIQERIERKMRRSSR